MSEPIILNNRYHLQGQLGSGGMAVVYRARDLMLERTVAVKVLREHFSSDPNFRHLFREEAKAVANLSHPNIVTVHDFGLQENLVFIVMEYVSGTDLKAIMKLQRMLDIDNALSLINQACEGIGFAHQAGLVHCDVKPQNLLVTPQGRLKVVDFGIARVLATIAPDERSEVVWGSPKYFSPEQARGIAPSPASDVYSLGVVLYEALTGELPFSADSADNLARMHREEPPPSPRKLNPRIPGELEIIILKAMSKNPDDRYQDAGLMAIALGNSSGMENATVIKPLADAIENQTTPAVDIEGENLVWTASEVATRESADSETAGRGYSLISQPDVGKSGRRIDFNWITWLLALLALLMAGGLIPFWLWVYYVLNPP